MSAGSLGAPSDFDARFASVTAEGSVLAASAESRVVHQQPFLLATECGGLALDLMIRRVTTFAFALSAIVGGLVVARVAPRPVAGFAAAWFIPSVAARWYARRRRGELGRALFDFESGSVHHVSLAGDARSLPISGATLAVVDSHDAQAPLALELRAPGHRPIRVARGVERELDRVLVVFRRYKVAVEIEIEREDG